MGIMNNQERGDGVDDDKRRWERQREFLGSEKGVVEGSGSVAGWSESVDRLMDASPRFAGAVRAAYSRFCLPLPDSVIPQERLLSALQYLLQIILEDLDETVGKVWLRPVTQEDIDVISRNDETLAAGHGQPINFTTFTLYARHALKRVALDRGKRLGLFMLGGLVVVHLGKSIVKRIPFIGPVVNALVPTILAGPAVGVAARNDPFIGAFSPRSKEPAHRSILKNPLPSIAKNPSLAQNLQETGGNAAPRTAVPAKMKGRENPTLTQYCFPT